VHALSGLAATYDCEVLYRWSKDPPAALETAKRLARRALDIDPYDHMALKMLTGAHLYRGELEDALSTARKQLDLNPNDAHSNRDLAAVLQWQGHWEEALRQVDVAQRLNPLDRSHVWKCHSIRARCLIVLHRYEEAIAQARLAAASDTAVVTPYLHLASAEALRGNLEVAKGHAAEVLRREPDFTIAKLMRMPETVQGRHRQFAGQR
jgi:tetratricopeptide (TPR) repeat protein